MALIKPHGGELSILFASTEQKQKIQFQALNLIDLTLKGWPYIKAAIISRIKK